LQGPERSAGSTLVVTAMVTDIAGNQTVSTPVSLLVESSGAEAGAGTLRILTSEYDRAKRTELLEEKKAEFVPGYTPVMAGGYFVVGSVVDFLVAADEVLPDRVEFHLNGSVVAASSSPTEIYYHGSGGSKVLV